VVLSDLGRCHACDTSGVTIVVTAPEPFDVPGWRVFLAGAIDMGRARNWQADIIAALAGRDGLVLVNPRRSSFDHRALDEQIRWELAALESVDMIAMWFPREVVAPVALLEAGLHLRSRKLIIGADAGYERRRNLEITTARYDVPLWNTLDDVVEEVLRAHRAERG
jgi:hypothetical protein